MEKEELEFSEGDKYQVNDYNDLIKYIIVKWPAGSGKMTIKLWQKNDELESIEILNVRFFEKENEKRVIESTEVEVMEYYCNGKTQKCVYTVSDLMDILDFFSMAT